jgi:hypothetical protein
VDEQPACVEDHECALDAVSGYEQVNHPQKCHGERIPTEVGKSRTISYSAGGKFEKSRFSPCNKQNVVS